MQSDPTPVNRAADSLAERRRGQMVKVYARPGEPPLAYLMRALAVNQKLLFADLFRSDDEH